MLLKSHIVALALGFAAASFVVTPSSPRERELVPVASAGCVMSDMFPDHGTFWAKFLRHSSEADPKLNDYRIFGVVRWDDEHKLKCFRENSWAYEHEILYNGTGFSRKMWNETWSFPRASEVYVDTPAMNKGDVTMFSFGVFNPGALQAGVSYLYSFEVMLPKNPPGGLLPLVNTGSIVHKNCSLGIHFEWCAGAVGGEYYQSYVAESGKFYDEATSCWTWDLSTLRRHDEHGKPGRPTWGPCPPHDAGQPPPVQQPPVQHPPVPQPPVPQPPVVDRPVSPPVPVPPVAGPKPTTDPPQPPKPAPKPAISNFQVVVYENDPGYVGVSYNVSWVAGRDPITCHFFIDGAEVFTAQCGNPSSKQFYNLSPGNHTFHATVNDRYGVYGDPSPTVTRYVPPKPAPRPEPKGFHVEDSYLGGTWARTDPNDGTWYSKGNRPPNGKYWFDNGLGIAVDCARSAAPYYVKFANGTTQTWRWWLHVTDDTWIPAATVRESSVDGPQGVPTC